MDIHQSKPLRMSLKETVGLELLRKIDEIRRLLTRSLNSRKSNEDTSETHTSTVDQSERSQTTICQELMEWRTILSSKKTYMIAISIKNKQCC